MARRVIVVDGNIATGKTAFIDFLNEKHLNEKDIVTLKEFNDPVGLELFYGFREQYTGLFEISNLVARIFRTLKAKHDPRSYIFDRGMISGAETFCKNSYDEGYLTHADYVDYQKTLKKGLDTLGRINQDCWLEKLIVYFQVTDIKILQDRQRKRNMEGEALPTGYLQRINDMYEQFIGNKDQVYRFYGLHPPEVLAIDASVDFNEDQNYHQRILDQIKIKIDEMEANDRT